MTKSTISCTKQQKTQFDKFMKSAVDSFIGKLMAEDDEDTSEEHLRKLASEFFNTKSFKVTRGGGKTSRVKSEGPKAPSNAYIQWSNAEGRALSQKELEKPHLKKLKKMSEEELSEKYDGETEINKILKTLVSSKDIISNAAKLWKQHKEDETDTYTKYQEMYEKQRAEFKALKENSNDMEAGPAEPPDNSDDEAEAAPKPTKGKSKAGGKTKAKTQSKAKSDSKTNTKAKAGGKSKSKTKASTPPQSDNEGDSEVEVKTYSLAEFETYDGLGIHLGMTLTGGFNTKFKKTEFDSLDEAVEAMNEDSVDSDDESSHSECMAIHLDKNGKFTIRSTTKMKEAKSNQSPCVTWVKEDDDSDEE